MKGGFLQACVSFIIAFVSLPASAQQGKNFWMANDRVSVNIGGFAADFQTELRLSSKTLGIGTKIDLEDDLGMDSDRLLARIDGYYRFSRRHKIEYSLLDVSRSGSVRIKRDIVVGDLFIPAGTPVKSEFKMAVLKGTYTYSFFQNRKVDLGVSAGITGLYFDADLAASLIGAEDAETFAPYPIYGLRLAYAFSRKLFLKASIDYFEIEQGDIEARVLDGLIALEHKTWKNVGLGGGYNAVDLEGGNIEDNDEGSLEYKGLLVYAKIYF